MNYFSALILSISLLSPVVAQAQEIPELTPEQRLEQQQQAEEFARDYQYKILFDYILEVAKMNHYNEVETSKLIEGAIKGMLRSLDSHSAYVSPEDMDEIKETMTGNFVGIGAVIGTDKNDRHYITRVIPGGGAEEVGLQPGDIIDEVDDEPTANMDVKGLVERIRGDEGTTVHIKIIREGIKIWFDIKRRSIESPVVYSEMIRDVLFISLRQFGPNAAKQIREAWEDNKDNNPEGIILDLRYNPGGLLTQAVEIVDMFSDEGIAVIQRDKGGENEEVSRVTNDVMVPLEMPLVVMINQHSASASEIVAGSLQQMGRATVIGVRSFGKGSVQSVMPLYNGGQLRITTQRYYTHNNTSPHDVGIEPDVLIVLDEESFIERENKQAFDNQLLRAIDIIKVSERK